MSRIRFPGVPIVFMSFAAWCAVFIANTAVRTYDRATVFCLFDDAMVSMRYAWNMAHGQGLVWNPGERVEGYTNLLQTLLMAALIGIFGKVKAVLAVQVMGVLALGTGGVFGLRFAERMSEESGLGLSAAWRALYLALALLYYPLAYWTLMGMETGLIAAGTMAAAWYGLTCPRDRVCRPLVVAAAALVLCRPDTVVPLAVVFLFRLAGAPRGGKAMTTVMAEGAVVAVVEAAAVLFRRAYYGAWVPNTYTLKVEGYPLSFRLAEGWTFVLPFLATIALPLGIAMAALVLRPSRGAGLAACLTSAAVLYQVWVGGDAWNYWRFLASSVPLLVLACAVELRHFARGASRWRGNAVVLAVLAVVVWRLNAAFLPEALFLTPPYEVAANARAVNVGLALRELTAETARLGVLRAGAIVYYAERRGVDFLGKSDPHIARMAPRPGGDRARFGMKSRPGHGKYDLDYSILQLRPTYVERLQWGDEDETARASLLYTKASYKGLRLFLLKDSPEVSWNALDPGSIPPVVPPATPGRPHAR